MEPLFNLYGNTDEPIATQTEITDEDIKQAKAASLQQTHQKFSSHEILSPKDIPDNELMKHCNEVFLSIQNTYTQQEDRDAAKNNKVLAGQPFDLKTKAYHKLISDQDPVMMNVLQTIQVDNEAALNCLAVMYHFENTPEEVGSTDNVLDPIPTDLPFYKKYPLITVAASLAIVTAILKNK